jgi:hypothetical protein
MTQLSPQAQTVLDAVCDNTEPDCDTQHLIAAALRAVVAHTQQRQYNECWICDANELLAIADELEAQ